MNPTHILFLDADIVPPAHALLKLLAINQPIVSGLYRKRLPPHEVMAFTKDKKGHYQPIALNKKNALQKVDVVGAGCLLIRQDVFEKIKAPWFTSEWSASSGSKGHLSEDFSFCERARKVGFKIWVDISVCPLHLEPMGIGTSQGSVKFVPMN